MKNTRSARVCVVSFVADFLFIPSVGLEPSWSILGFRKLKSTSVVVLACCVSARVFFISSCLLVRSPFWCNVNGSRQETHARIFVFGICVERGKSAYFRVLSSLWVTA